MGMKSGGIIFERISIILQPQLVITSDWFVNQPESLLLPKLGCEPFFLSNVVASLCPLRQ